MSKSNKNKLIGLIAVLVIGVAGMAYFGVTWLMDARATSAGQDFFVAQSEHVPVIPRVHLPEFPTAPANEEEDLPFAPVVDFYALRAEIPNLIGWIQSYGTNINYPIVQFSDNYFYLSHLPDGASNRMGSIFLDYRHCRYFSSPAMIIYGHNMASGDKFSSLRNYLNHQYFLNHSTMFIFTPDGNFELRIFAGYDIDSTMEHPPLYFPNEEHFNRFFVELQNRSFIQSGWTPHFGQQIVYLATCIYAGDSPWRRIIVGVLEPVDW